MTVRGLDGRQESVELVVDTGFTDFLMLPHAVFESLGLLPDSQIEVQLADGSETVLPVYRTFVLWDGQERRVAILEAEGDALLGMALLAGYRVAIEVCAGGLVSIEALA